MKCYIFVLSLALMGCRSQKETVHQFNESVETGQMIECVTTVEYENEVLNMPGQIDIDCKPTNKPKRLTVRTVKKVSNSSNVQKSDSAWLKKENSAAHQETGILHNCKSMLMMLGIVFLILLLFQVFRLKK